MTPPGAVDAGSQTPTREASTQADVTRKELFPPKQEPREEEELFPPKQEPREEERRVEVKQSVNAVNAATATGRDGPSTPGSTGAPKKAPKKAPKRAAQGRAKRETLVAPDSQSSDAPSKRRPHRWRHLAAALFFLLAICCLLVRHNSTTSASELTTLVSELANDVAAEVSAGAGVAARALREARAAAGVSAAATAAAAAAVAAAVATREASNILEISRVEIRSVIKALRRSRSRGAPPRRLMLSAALRSCGVAAASAEEASSLTAAAVRFSRWLDQADRDTLRMRVLAIETARRASDDR